VLAVALGLALLVGVSLGTLGGGGSLLTVPILLYVLEIEPHQAVATSLLVVGCTSLAALVPHARAGRIRWKIGALFGFAGMTGSFCAGKLSPLAPAALLLMCFGLMMLAAAAAMFRGRRATTAHHSTLPVGKVVAQGLTVGAVSGFVGAGGGFLVVPALAVWGGLAMEAAVGTSLLVVAMQSLAGFAGHLSGTPINWVLAAEVTAAAVVGSLAGAQLAGRLSPDRLRRSFAWFVVAMASLVLGQQVPELFGAPHGSTIRLAGLIALLVFAYGLWRERRGSTQAVAKPH
jgi:uncharacterized protein